MSSMTPKGTAIWLKVVCTVSFENRSVLLGSNWFLETSLMYASSLASFPRMVWPLYFSGIQAFCQVGIFAGSAKAAQYLIGNVSLKSLLLSSMRFSVNSMETLGMGAILCLEASTNPVSHSFAEVHSGSEINTIRLRFRELVVLVHSVAITLQSLLVSARNKILAFQFSWQRQVSHIPVREVRRGSEYTQLSWRIIASPYLGFDSPISHKRHASTRSRTPRALCVSSRD